MESVSIRKRPTTFAVLLELGAEGVPVFAQQTDPTLTATVVAQTAELKSVRKKRGELQEHIIATEAAVAVALDRVYSVEDKMLEYLLNAQGAMRNLYQIRRAGELVAMEVPKSCSLLTKSVDGDPKGAAIATIMSDELTDAATQVAALHPFMEQLVTSGNYNVTGSDGRNEKYKVSLLDSSECYYITNKVVTRLETINTDFFVLTWQVCALSWNDLWLSLSPESWANMMSGKNIVSGIMAGWSQDYLLKW